MDSPSSGLRWEYGPSDTLFIAKGNQCLIALLDANDGKGTIGLYRPDGSDWQILGWRDDKKLAVAAAEELVAAWFPDEPPPTLPPIPLREK